MQTIWQKQSRVLFNIFYLISTSHRDIASIFIFNCLIFVFAVIFWRVSSVLLGVVILYQFVCFFLVCVLLMIFIQFVILM